MPRTWVNGGTPALSAANLNELEGELANAVTAVGRDQLLTTTRTEPLSKQGAVLFESTVSNQWDSSVVESPCVFRDPVTGKLAMLFTAYSRLDGTAIASHGIAYSTDGIRWTDQAQYFTASGTGGAADQYGVTGPVTIFENGTQHLFYIGLTALGYEGGTKTLCRASRPIGTGAWTRHGAVMSPGGTGWREFSIWRPNFVKRGNTWYCFVNASGDPDNKERIGYATATSLDGTWTFDDTNSPLMADLAGTEYSIHGGDPFVRQLADGSWRMDFFRAGNNASGYGAGYDTYATTTDEKFPLGWVEGAITLQPTTGTYDGNYAHKPWIAEINGREFHYYTSVASTGTYTRRIALATDGAVYPGIVTGTDNVSRALVRAGLARDGATAILSDNFTRADGALGNATTGQAWTGATGWAIASNKLAFTGSADAAIWIDPACAEWDAELVVDSIGGGNYPFGIGIGDPAAIWIKAYRDTGKWQFAPMNAGSLNGYTRATVSPFAAGTLIIRRRNKMLTIEAGGVVFNTPTYTEPSSTKFGIVGSGSHALTISRLTLVKYITPIKPA